MMVSWVPVHRRRRADTDLKYRCNQWRACSPGKPSGKGRKLARLGHRKHDAWPDQDIGAQRGKEHQAEGDAERLSTNSLQKDVSPRAGR